MIIVEHEEGLEVDKHLVKWDQLPVLERKLRLLAYSELKSGAFECFGIGVEVMGRWQYQLNGEPMDAAKLFEMASQLTVYSNVQGKPFCVLRDCKREKVMEDKPMRPVANRHGKFVPIYEIDSINA